MTYFLCVTPIGELANSSETVKAYYIEPYIDNIVDIVYKIEGHNENK